MCHCVDSPLSLQAITSYGSFEGGLPVQFGHIILYAVFWFVTNWTACAHTKMGINSWYPNYPHITIHPSPDPFGHVLSDTCAAL